MDYRKLLIKYIVHILDNEGISYIDWLNNDKGSAAVFTAEEIKELKALDKEAVRLSGRNKL